MSVARQALRPLTRLVRERVLPRIIVPPAGDRAIDATADAARVVGLLSSASGLGNSARLCVDELRSSGCEVTTVDVAPAYGIADGIAFERGDGSRGRIALFHLNPPMLMVGIICAGLRRYYDSLNIGYWAWELEALPRDWVAAIPYVDAIMVPSEFCRAAIGRYTDKPVLVLPPPLQEIAAGAEIRPATSNPAFHVLTVANFGSSFERKNPIGAVQAFRTAFGDDPSARLTIKTSDGKRYPRDLSRLRAAIASAPNVQVIDEAWSDGRMRQLYRSANAYLLLHRSEGYGLTIAEAMFEGTPVVVTGWSGNLDYCTDDTAYLAGYRIIPCKDPHPAYARMTGARWAEPSILEAAQHLRRIRQFPAEAVNKAAVARRRLIERARKFSYKSALEGLLATCGRRG